MLFKGYLLSLFKNLKSFDASLDSSRGVDLIETVFFFEVGCDI